MSTKNNNNMQTKDELAEAGLDQLPEQRKATGGDCSLHSYNKVQVKVNVSMHKLYPQSIKVAAL